VVASGASSYAPPEIVGRVENIIPAMMLRGQSLFNVSRDELVVFDSGWLTRFHQQGH
jgi:hypothetical protein